MAEKKKAKAKKAEPKKKPAPKCKIDKEQFEKLCALQCTQIEFLGWFDVEDDTLEAWCRREYGKRFSEVFQQKRSHGRISLRRSQFQLAENNATMAIWLGKQYLGQTDKIQILQPNPQMDALIEAVGKIPVIRGEQEESGSDED